MSDKTLVERLREVNSNHIKHPVCQIANAVGVGCGCKTCSECEIDTAQALADAIEREYLPRPRFDDGEPVQFGDEYETEFGETGKVNFFCFADGGVYRFRGGEHWNSTASVLKRQKPEVLDADGVPIKVGDVVWFVGGAEYFDVLRIESDGEVHIGRNDGTSTDAWAAPSDLTHKQPDSLERIEADALMDSIDYCDKYGLLDSECNAEEGDEAARHCTDCGFTCETRMVKHILRRQREVLERNHER